MARCGPIVEPSIAATKQERRNAKKGQRSSRELAHSRLLVVCFFFLHRPTEKDKRPCEVAHAEVQNFQNRRVAVVFLLAIVEIVWWALCRTGGKGGFGSTHADKDTHTRTLPVRMEVGLLHMPPELLVSIMNRLGRASEVVACARMVGLDAGDVLAQQKGTPTAAVIGSGAPLHIVRPFVARRRRCHHQGGRKRMPIEWLLAAAEGGRTDVVAWMHDANKAHTAERLARWGAECGVPFAIPTDAAGWVMAHAARHGSHDVLAWLMRRYGRPRFCRGRAVSGATLKRVALAALSGPSHAIAGTLGVVHGARPERTCSCPAALVAAAAKAGRLDVLSWMYDRGCPAIVKRSVVGWVLVRAVRCGHIDVARWAAERMGDQTHHLKALPMRQAMVRAASRGHIRTVEFACDLGLWDFPVEIVRDYWHLSAGPAHSYIIGWAIDNLTLSPDPGPRSITSWPHRWMDMAAQRRHPILSGCP